MTRLATAAGLNGDASRTSARKLLAVRHYLSVRLVSFPARGHMSPNVV